MYGTYGFGITTVSKHFPLYSITSKLNELKNYLEEGPYISHTQTFSIQKKPKI